MKYIITSFLILVSVSLSAQELQLNLEQGKTYVLNLTSDVAIKQQFGSMDMDMDVIIGSKNSYRVDAIRDSVYDITVSYDRFSINIKTPSTQNLEFDSSSARADDAFSKALGGLVGSSYTISLSKHGKVVAISGVDKAFEEIVSKFPGASPETKQQILQQIKQSYSEATVRNSLESAFGFFQGGKLRSGYKWTSGFGIENLISADIKTAYEIKELTDSYVIVAGQGNMEAVDVNSVGGSSVKAKFSGDIGTTVRLDRKSGWIVNQNITQNVKGTIETPQGSMPMMITTKIVLTSE